MPERSVRQAQDRPVVQINLPPMPNPKDFKISGNPTTNAGLWQMALNAWREASSMTAQAVSASLAPPREASVPTSTVGPITDLTKN